MILHVAVLLGFLALSLAFFPSTWADPAHRIAGGYGDSTVALWDLNWFSWAILHLHNPLYTHFASAPTGANMIAQPESAPLLSIVMAPVTFLFGPIVSYNIVATTAFGLTAFTTFVTLRQWIGGVVGPLLGGLAFGFSPYMQAQGTGHTGLVTIYLVPLIFLFIVDLVKIRRWSSRFDAIAVGVLCFFQLLMTEEILLGVVIGAVVITIFFAVQQRHDPEFDRIAAVKSLVLGAAVFVALSLLPVTYQIEGPGHFSGLAHTLNYYVVDLLGVLLPTPGVERFMPDNGGQYYLTWGWNTKGPEIVAYVGTFLLVAGMALTRRWRHPFVRLATVLFIVFFVLSLGPSLHVAGVDLQIWLPWRPIQYLPLIENVLPSRLFMYSYFALAILIAVAVEGIVRHRSMLLRAIGAVIVIGSFFTWVPRSTIPANEPVVPAFFTSADVDAIPPGSLVFLSGAQDSNVGGWLPMLWQIEAGMRFRITGGEQFLPGPQKSILFNYGLPNPLVNAVQQLSEGAKAVSYDGPAIASMRRTLFSSYRADDAVVGPMGLGQLQVIQLLTLVIGEPPRLVDGVALWTGLQEQGSRLGVIR